MRRIVVLVVCNVIEIIGTYLVHKFILFCLCVHRDSKKEKMFLLEILRTKVTKEFIRRVLPV